MMKKWMCALIALMMCLMITMAVTAESTEDNDNTGTVTVVDPSELIGTVYGEEPAEIDPVVPDNVERFIFNGDSRSAVNVRAFPYCAIAYIKAKGECGDSWTGSGFVAGVNGNTVITAAHCLVCPKHGKWAKSLEFYFGYKSSKNYLHKYSGRWSAYVGNTFSNREYTYEGDWGVVRLLGENISSKVGGFGARYNMADSAITSKYIYAAGYSDASLQSDGGYLSVLDSSHVQYKLDTIEGDSGGPLFDGDNFAVGIIIGGTSRNGTPLYNVGHRLTSDIRSAVEALQ